MSVSMLGAPQSLADRNAPDTVYYARSRIDPACRIIPLSDPGAPDGLLVVDTRKGLWTEFVVLEWCEEDAQCDGGDNWYEVVFRGEGPSGALRELRHTYWGRDGYLFYAPGQLIAAAFEALKEWFDV